MDKGEIGVPLIESWKVCLKIVYKTAEAQQIDGSAQCCKTLRI
jgi:hypothetical protein